MAPTLNVSTIAIVRDVRQTPCTTFLRFFAALSGANCKFMMQWQEKRASKVYVVCAYPRRKGVYERSSNE